MLQMEGRRWRVRPQRSTSVLLAALAASVVAVLGPPRVHKVDRRHPHLVFFKPAGPSMPESSPLSKWKKSAPGLDEQPSRPVDSDAVWDSGRETYSTASLQLVQLFQEDQGVLWQWKQYCFDKGHDGSLHVKKAPVEVVEQFLAARCSGAIEEVDMSPDDYLKWLDEVKKIDHSASWLFVQYCNSECFGIRDPTRLPAEKMYPFMTKYVAGEFGDLEMADKDTIERLKTIKENCIEGEWNRLTDERMLGHRNPVFFPRTDAQRFLEYFELKQKEKEQQSIDAAAKKEKEQQSIEAAAKKEKQQRSIEAAAKKDKEKKQLSTKPQQNIDPEILLQQLLAEIAGSDQSVQVATKGISYSLHVAFTGLAGQSKTEATRTVNIPLQFTGLAGQSKTEATRSAAEKALQVLSNLVMSFLKASKPGMTKYTLSKSEEGSYVATVVLTDDLRGKVPVGRTFGFVGVASPTDK